MELERRARIDAVLADRDGVSTLEALLVVVVDMLSVSGAGVAIISEGQHRGAVAISDPAFAAVDELQFSLGEGPGFDADRDTFPILEPDLRVAAQWPAFAPAAVALRTNAAFAFPLGVGAVRLGVLNLYRDEPGDLSDEDLGDALTLARIATNLLLELEAATKEGSLPPRLEDVLDHRAHVHQATGMLAAQLDCDLQTALARLRAFAWSHDRSIDDVAAAVVNRSLRFEDG